MYPCHPTASYHWLFAHDFSNQLLYGHLCSRLTSGPPNRSFSLDHVRKTFCFPDGEMCGRWHCVYSLHNILLPVKKIDRSSFKAQVVIITVKICAVLCSGVRYTLVTFNFPAGSVKKMLSHILGVLDPRKMWTLFCYLQITKSIPGRGLGLWISDIKGTTTTFNFQLHLH